MGMLDLGGKSDLLVCLEGVAQAQSDAPRCYFCCPRGAVIAQMLKHGIAFDNENMSTKSSSHPTIVSFVVYHVLVSFGIVIKTTPRRR